MEFMPIDKKYFNKLQEQFEFLFEPQLIKDLNENGTFKSVKADEEIIDIGTLITHMPLVINGSIKVMTEDKEGNELLLYYLESADTCAVTLNCCSSKAKSTVRAIAETDSDLLFIPVDKMDEWMVKFKSWRHYVLDSYNTRLNEMVSAIDNIVFQSMEERLVKYLLDKAWVTKSATLNLTHQEIANDLHSSRVVISRLMKKLENNKIIKQQRNKVVVTKYEAQSSVE